jgi:4-hydroxy-2-oxoheptanedioate aldolase
VEPNKIKAALRSGESVRGLFVKTPDPLIAELLGICGLDFAVCDSEHGTSSVGDLENFCRALELRGSTPFVRVGSSSRIGLSRSFDAGAMGVHVPWVEDAETAHAVIDAVKYLPEGKRGLAGSRTSHYGIDCNLVDYMARSNQETLVVAQIESRNAVDNADSIARTPGVDVVFVGPTDLSNSIGRPLDFDNQELTAMIQQVVDTTLRHGKTFGIFVRNAQEIAHWEAQGARYFISNFEALAARAVKEYVQHGRHA